MKWTEKTANKVKTSGTNLMLAGTILGSSLGTPQAEAALNTLPPANERVKLSNPAHNHSVTSKKVGNVTTYTTNDTTSMTLNGETPAANGGLWKVQGTTNFLGPRTVWTDLVTNTVPFNFTQTNAPGVKEGFYRASLIKAPPPPLMGMSFTNQITSASGIKHTNSHPLISVNGFKGTNYVLLSTTKLSPDLYNWTPLTNATSPYNFVDETKSGKEIGGVFYQAVPLLQYQNWYTNTGPGSSVWNNSVVLEWSSVPGATGYAIYSGNTSNLINTRYDTGTNTTLRTPHSLKLGSTNFFDVVAYNAKGESDPSAPALKFIVPGANTNSYYGR